MILYTILALGLPSLLYYVYAYLKNVRSLFPNVPSLKRRFVFGNILEMGKYMKPDRHPDYGLQLVYEDLGQPDFFLLDVAPIFRMLIVTSPMIAEQGEDWKTQRKQFQFGFQSKHLQTLLPLMIEETQILVTKLMEKTESDKPFMLGEVLQNLTLDVITCVVLGQSIHAQTTPDGQGVRGPRGVLTAFREVQKTVKERGNISLSSFSPVRLWKMYHYERILDEQMQNLIEEAIRDPDPSSRAVVHLALKDRPITPATLQEAADQLRTFVFAGFDTTSTTLQWAFYYLSLPSNAAALEALYAEHDSLLGPVDDKDAIEAFLRTDLTMPYTTAVIKESLRLEPPAATARWVPPSDEPFFLTAWDGTQHQVNGTVVYINHKVILNSTKIWGPDAKMFRPERWLDKEYVANLPAGAFRPFERGPRACIGQELAMMEAKVVLALVARRFTFMKITPPDEVSDLGDVWNIYRITATPNDSMRMVIKKRC